MQVYGGAGGIAVSNTCLDLTGKKRHNYCSDMRACADTEIESQFALLPHSVQLSLLERLARQVQAGGGPGQEEWESELSAMAADPEMQRELRRISAEFTATEADGLGRIWWQFGAAKSIWST